MARKAKEALFTSGTNTGSNFHHVLVDWSINKGDAMKKLLLDLLIAGAVLYGASALYGSLIALLGMREITLLSYCVIGYLTVRVTNSLRNK